jgi:hypothetical protein
METEEFGVMASERKSPTGPFLKLSRIDESGMIKRLSL